jgi:aryl-alcohol dehydrogenase-like predicted oxidoreductase
MEYRNVGNSNLKASVIGFGSLTIGGDIGLVNTNDILSLVKEAYNLGINFFDTAPIYGVYGWDRHRVSIEGFGYAERLLGEAFKGIRDKVIIATKFGIGCEKDSGKEYCDSSRKNIKKEIDESLERLQTDYIDLYQVHEYDPQTPIEETFITLNEIKKSGKIRYIGVCNYSISLMEEALRYSEIESSQNLYNMIQRNSDGFLNSDLLYRTESEILPFCEEKNLGFIPYAPFCEGLLTGKLLKLEDYKFEDGDLRRLNSELYGEKLKKNLELVKELLKISNKIGKPMTQMVLNWLRKDKRITSIIVGTRKISEIKDNVESTTWSLDDSTYKEINKLINK